MSKGLLFSWTDKNGKKLSAKEFMQRWKEGMQKVTPLQQLKMQIPNYWIIMAGILLGVGITGYNHTWWLMAILIGTLGINIISFLGVWQKYKMLKSIDDELKQPQQQVQTQQSIREVANGES